MRYIKAFWLGFADAYAQQGELSMGRTWQTDQGMNESYDHGANTGEKVWRILHPLLRW